MRRTVYAGSREYVVSCQEKNHIERRAVGSVAFVSPTLEEAMFACTHKKMRTGIQLRRQNISAMGRSEICEWVLPGYRITNDPKGMEYGLKMGVQVDVCRVLLQR